MAFTIFDDLDKLALTFSQSKVVESLTSPINDLIGKKGQVINGFANKFVDPVFEGLNWDDFFLKGLGYALDGALDAALVFFETFAWPLITEEYILCTVGVETNIVGIFVLQTTGRL